MQTNQPRPPRKARGKSLGPKVRPKARRPKAGDAVAPPENPHARSGDKRNRVKPVAEERKVATRRDRKSGMRPEPIKVRARKHLTPEALKARSEVRRARHKQRKLAALKTLLAEIEAEKAA